MTGQSRCPFIVATPVKVPRGNIHTTRLIVDCLRRSLKQDDAYDVYVEQHDVWKLDGLEKPISISVFKKRCRKLKELRAIPTRSFCGQPASYMVNGSSLCWEHADHLSRHIVSDDLFDEFSLALKDNVSHKEKLAIERSRTTKNRNWLLGKKS